MNQKIFFLLACFSFAFSYFTETVEFHYVTTLKNEVESERQNELFRSICENLENQNISTLTVFYEGVENDEMFKKIKTINSSKLLIENINFRPSLEYIFSYCNTNFPKQYIIVSNADISFDRSLNKIKPSGLENTILALSRYNKIGSEWEVSDIGFFKNHKYYSASQDAWIFQTPLECNPGIMDRFWLGKWGVEKFINYFIKLGYQVKNPCLELKTYHHHYPLQSGIVHTLYDDLPHVYLKYSNLYQDQDLIIDFADLVSQKNNKKNDKRFRR